MAQSKDIYLESILSEAFSLNILIFELWWSKSATKWIVIQICQFSKWFFSLTTHLVFLVNSLITRYLSGKRFMWSRFSLNILIFELWWFKSATKCVVHPNLLIFKMVFLFNHSLNFLRQWLNQKISIWRAF